VGDFYGTGIEIWAGIWPVGITEKNILADYEQLFSRIFSSFHGRKKLKTLKRLH
jgi:hypothetical protein